MSRACLKAALVVAEIAIMSVALRAILLTHNIEKLNEPESA